MAYEEKVVAGYTEYFAFDRLKLKIILTMIVKGSDGCVFFSDLS